MVPVILIDDHPLVLRGITELLATSGRYRVVARFHNPVGVLPYVQQTHPAAAVLDLVMPNEGGLPLIPRLRRAFPALKIVVLTMLSGAIHVREALRLGADAYVLKCDAPRSLLQAFEAAFMGRRYLSDGVAHAELEGVTPRHPREPDVDSYEKLSRREREVLRLIAEGRTNVQVASALVLSVRTVETHRANITRKTGLTNHTDLLRFAIAHGVLHL